jgi:hypothetical protein
MYLQLLNYVSYFLSIVFIIFLCYSLDWKMIKEAWQKAETKTLLKKLENKITKAEQKGETRFEFNHGKTVVYGKDYKDAYNKFKILEREAKAVKNKLRKV